MIRTWIALALLAGSWLLGLHYFQPAAWTAWAMVTLGGTLLLANTPLVLPTRRQAVAAAILTVPVVWFMPWPYRAAPLLILVGLVLHLLPIPRRWPQGVARGTIAAGTVLLGQSLAILGYAHVTARSHELPGPLADLLGAAAWLTGADVAVDGDALVLRSMREVHRLGATWELLLDPATLCFLVGGFVWLGLAAASGRTQKARNAWLIAAGQLALVVAVWLPIRAGLLIGLLLHRVVRADPAVPLTTMNQFLSPWLQLGLLVVPVLLAWRFVRGGGEKPGELPSPLAPLPRVGEESFDTAAPPRATVGAWLAPAAVGLVGVGVTLWTVAAVWEPIGQPKDGRVMVVERHSTWEPTLRPYDTTWFGHDSSYTYSAIYDYASRFYTMSRLLQSDAIDDRTLDGCDVLVIKVPTSAFESYEIEAVQRFVERGGGLLLIGDHTNVFKSSSYLNEITRPWGFTYRHDLLYTVGSPFYQAFRPGLVPHPAVQHVPPMEFAVTCSIDPGTSRGRAVVQKTGLWSLPPVYYTENFQPEAEYQAPMRYGSFIQVWSTRHGAGRVLAFTDSTIFSNFCTFEPGKAEIILGMLQWLNHRSSLDRDGPRITLVAFLTLAGAGELALGLWWARRASVGWLLMLVSAMLGWTVASAAIVFSQHRAMPAPQPTSSQAERPLVRVVLDRTVSAVPLSRNGFSHPSGRGFALLEQWIPRLGYRTMRQVGDGAFTGDLLVVLCPTRSPSEQYLKRLSDYVEQGGRLLVVDSPDVENSTANALLWPFGLSIERGYPVQGSLKASASKPALPVESACEVDGGESVLRVGARPVVAKAAYGKGRVMAVGLASLFRDEQMGGNWMTQPDANLLARFDLLFRLVRSAATDQPITEPAPTQHERSPSKSRKIPLPRLPGKP